jgi:GNAT superfamily N-acetyltransferase
MTARRLAPITLDNLDDLLEPCRGCVFWEAGPLADSAREAMADGAFEKEAWLSSALLEWGSVGRIAYLGERPAGYLLYAPAYLVPRALAFPTSPVSPDAVLLMTGRVDPSHSRAGLGRMLVQGMAKDLSRRGVRAVEAFGSARSGGPGCLLPADFLLSVGFKTVRPHHRTPRLRLDLRSLVSWREDVEQALERLLGSVRTPAAPVLHRR